MRFDYQLPSTQLRLFRIRRHFTPLLAGFGIACILIALIYKPSDSLGEKIRIPLPGPLLNSDLDIKETVNLDHSEKITQDNWNTVLIKRGDTLSSIFEDHGIPGVTIHKIFQSNPSSKQLAKIHPGQTLDLLLDDDNELKELKLHVSPTRTLQLLNSQEGYKFYYQEKQLLKKYGYSANVISDSLFLSAQKVGLNDKIIMQLTDIFGWDIDFALDIRPGDEFKVLYEEIFLEGERIDTGNIIAAEFVNRGKTYKAIRYVDKKGNASYYSPEGYGMQKAFIRTPVKFTRISSRFSTGRRHPILHKIRAHKGVDYVAPRGTPIKAAGDGRISFKGTKGGYGKTIVIQHGKKYSTLYAHLSNYGRKIARGSLVKQGQIIGYVGSTGLATGNHLHYEFRVNGIHRDPLTVKLPQADPVSDDEKTEFLVHSKKMLKILKKHRVTNLARK